MIDPKVYEVTITLKVKKTVQVRATKVALDSRIDEVIEELQDAVQYSLGAVSEFDWVDVEELM